MKSIEQDMKMVHKYHCLSVDSSLVDISSQVNLLVDIRDPNMYHKSHLENSINLVTSSLLLRRLQRGSLTIDSLLPRDIVQSLKTDILSIILYDEDSRNGNESKLITLIASALRKEFPKVNTVYINGGFNEFCKRYPSQCEFDYPVEQPNPFHISVTGTNDFNDPTDKVIYTPASDTCPVLILPYLYLGNAQHSSEKDLLDKLGITAILNVSKNCPVLFQNHYEYKTIPVDDTNHENISLYFEEAVKFIDDIKSKGGKILVHCRAGISRSATICIAYLMRIYNYTLDQAYEFIKKRRAAISPNFNFLGQLLKLESELLLQRQQQDGKKCPLTVTLPIQDDISAPLSLGPKTSKVSQYFTYSPNSCSNLFNMTNSDSMSPLCPILLTPS